MEGGESAEAPPAATAEEMQQAEMEALAGLIGMVVGLIVSLILLYKLIVWIYRLVVPKKSAAHLPSADPVGAAATAPANVAAKANSKTPNQCNVVSVSRGQRKLWRFGISGKGRSNLMQEFTELPEENLPVKVVGKGWGDLLNPRLNIAWLASDKVFLRVADFPVCDHEELLSMIELQLDQLSPLPVTQIVWTYEALPSVDGEMQTIVLAIASRAKWNATWGSWNRRATWRTDLNCRNCISSFPLTSRMTVSGSCPGPMRMPTRCSSPGGMAGRLRILRSQTSREGTMGRRIGRPVGAGRLGG